MLRRQFPYLVQLIEKEHKELTRWLRSPSVTLDWDGAGRHTQPPRPVLDGRNCLEPERLLACGLECIGIGRRSPAWAG